MWFFVSNENFDRPSYSARLALLISYLDRLLPIQIVILKRILSISLVRLFLMLFLLFTSVCFLSFANGANDNFKGVATLYGSGTASYRVALFWATLATLAGARCAW